MEQMITFERNENQTSSSEIGTLPSSYSNLTWDLYLRIVVAFLGILANVLNVFVFLDARLKDIAYKYMLADSICNIIYLGLSLSSVFFYYCSGCPSSQTYLAAILSIAITNYLLDCLKLMHVLLEVIMSFRIYFILVNKSFERVSYKLVLIMLSTISLGFFVQEPFSFEIFDMGNLNGIELYSIKANRFGSSTIEDVLVLFQFGTRVFLAVIVLSIVNVFNVVEFKKRFGKNRSYNRRVMVNSKMPHKNHESYIRGKRANYM